MDDLSTIVRLPPRLDAAAIEALLASLGFDRKLADHEPGVIAPRKLAAAAERLDIHALDRALRQTKLSAHDRMILKGELARHGLLV